MLIDRYLLRQLLLPLVAVSLTVSTLFVTFTLARLLADAGSGLLQFSEIFRVTWLRWLIAQDVLLPISLYLAIVLLWGRLYQDLEMDAMMAAGGLGEARLALPALAAALLVALTVALFTAEVRPWAWHQVYRIKAEAEASAELERIRADRFNLYGGNHTVFIDQIRPDNTLEGIFVRRREGGELEMVTATKGHFTAYVTNDSHELVLEDALAFRAYSDGPELSGRFGTLTLNLKAATPRSVTGEPKVKSVTQLAESADPDDRAELQWRLSAPLSAVLLALLATPLARSGPRQSRHARVILALALYAVYFNLMAVARTWVEQGLTDSIIWVHGTVAVVIAVLWWRRPRR